MSSIGHRSSVSALVLSAALLFASPGTVRAELGQDTHIQETGEIRIEVDRQVLEEFGRLFELGYPPATVMLHAVSTGMSINDILYIAVKSNPDRAAEFYDTADSLLPALPGWACQANEESGRYTREVDLGSLNDRSGVRDVAALYFDQDLRVIPFPDWLDGRVHMEASVDELSGLIDDQKWYVPGDDDGTPRTAPNRPVFISLYKHSGEIVLDSGAETIRRAREQGIERLPVVLVYNDVMQRPITAFPPEATVYDLSQQFYDEGLELTSVPEWRVGDHHTIATIDELREVVDIPAREDVPEPRWNAVADELQSANLELDRPMLLTLVRSGGGRAWIDDPVKVAVASSLGVDSFPLVFFYHRIDRRSCGQPSDCEDLLCEAATAAGASEEVCSSDGEQTTAGATPGDAPDGAGLPVALHLDPRLYEGLSYTQNQCKS